MDASSPAGSSLSSCRRTLLLLSLLTLVSCGGESPTDPTPVPDPDPDPDPQEPEGLSGQVAYAVFDFGNGAWSLTRQALGGGEPIALELERGDEDGLPDRAVFQVRWSPDGSSLLYQSTKTNTDDWYLVLVDPNGKNRRLLTPHNGFAIDPEFSPAGDRILYKRGGLTPLGLGIPTQTSIVDLDGVSVDVVLEEGGLVEGRPVYFDQYESEDRLYDAQWGGDDAHLLVVGFFDASPLVSAPRVDQVEVFRVSLATGRVVQRVTRNAVDETRFHASPDGTKLLVNRSTTTGREAVLLTAGGTEDRVIATNFDFLPRWASDSRHVSYGGPDGIWLLEVGGADLPTRLNEGSGGTPSRTGPDLYLER